MSAEVDVLTSRRRLGASQVEITRMVFGGAPIGGLFAPVSDDDADAALEAAWEAGIRSFDTAPHYGVGVSETRLGRFLAARPRHEYVVSTKVGRLLVPTTDPVEGAEGFYGTPRLTRVRDYSADGVRRSLEESLGRLGLDRVDILLIHDPDEHWQQAVSEAYPALDALRRDGVVGAIGVGMNQTEMLERFVRETDVDVVLVAGRYSLLDRRAAASLLPTCAERGVGVLVGGVFNSGILAAPDVGAHFDYAPAPPEVMAAARRLQGRCQAAGVTLPAAALQFPLRHPAVDGIVVGARSEAEVRANCEGLRRTVPESLWADLDAHDPDAGAVPGASDAV